MSEDEKAIRAIQITWIKATTEGDLDTVLNLMAEDVVFLTLGRPPFGRDEFAKSFEAGRQTVHIECEGEYEEVVVSGDIAHARGRLRVIVTPRSGGQVKQLSGYTLSIFRRLSNGRWVLSRDANLLSPEMG